MEEYKSETEIERYCIKEHYN